MLCSHSEVFLLDIGINSDCCGSVAQVHSLLEQHEQSLVPPMTPAAQPLPQQPLSTGAEQVPPQTPAPVQQLPEEQLPHMENMGYDVVSPVHLFPAVDFSGTTI
jgi:hypothetical protein